MTQVTFFSELSEFTQSFENLQAAMHAGRTWSKAVDHAAVVKHNGKFHHQFGHRVDVRV